MSSQISESNWIQNILVVLGPQKHQVCYELYRIQDILVVMGSQKYQVCSRLGIKYRVQNITSNNRKTGVNGVALMNKFEPSSVKCWTANFCIHASKGPVIIMNQLNPNRPLNDLHSHPTWFPIIASNKSDGCYRSCESYLRMLHKKAFQQEAYRPLADHAYFSSHQMSAQGGP